MNKTRINEILRQNKDKPFVKRILNPEDYPELDLGEGRIATHKMAWSRVDDGYIAYPTIEMENGELKELGNSIAPQRAMKTDNFIKFDNAEEAETFTKEYKKIWNKKK